MNKNKITHHQFNRVALRTALIYIVLSALWIVFSDRLLLNNPSTAIFISTIKGWVYTLVMGILIYFALDRELKKVSQANERLKELDRLKDNFLSVATHELKTPLIPIKSQAQLLLGGDYGALNPEQIRAIEMIARNEENLNRLTSDVMDISKIKSNKLSLILEEVAIDELLSDVVADLEYLAKEKNITIVLDPIINIPTLLIDKPRIAQVLNNIIGNAIKFTPENGKILINLENTNKEILVTVKDSGIGINKDNLQKIFTPFFQIQNDLNRKYRGTGLGLAIASGIVEAHGGKIWAKSDGDDKGSSFIFSLPIK